jgi:xylulokinase
MYIGIDLGTSSIKLILCNSKGKIISKAKRNYHPLSPFPNYSEQDPDEWYNSLLECFSDLREKYDLSKVRALSFCGQMHGLVILDKDDKVIRPAILWNDNRTIAETTYLNNTIGKSKLLEYTGNIAYPGMTGTKLLWLKNNEEHNFKLISKIMLPKDYLVYKLTNIFASDVSDNSGTLYFDVEKKKWSKEMLDILSINESQLPKIFESSDCIGNISSLVANQSGLSTLTKVIIGGGDQAVGAIGTGCISNKEETNSEEYISISLGTSGVVFAHTKQYSIALDGIHSFCHSDGNYLLMGCMLSAAGSLDWWLNDILKTSSYKRELALIENGYTEDLYFLPYLAGERSPINDPNAVGIFYGLKSNHTRLDMTKSVVEGVSFGLKDCLECMKISGVNPKFGIVIGGGSKSEEWLQLLSNVLNLELRTISTSEGGALGAVILSMVGDKVFSSIAQACKNLISYKKVFLPNADKAINYHLRYKEFKKIYLNNKDR